MKIEKFCLLSNGALKEEYDIPNVIRCEDCKWWQKDFIPKRSLADDVGHSACMRLNGIILMDANDFCSRGERKDEED